MSGIIGSLNQNSAGVGIVGGEVAGIESVGLAALPIEYSGRAPAAQNLVEVAGPVRAPLFAFPKGQFIHQVGNHHMTVVKIRARPIKPEVVNVGRSTAVGGAEAAA